MAQQAKSGENGGGEEMKIIWHHKQLKRGISVSNGNGKSWRLAYRRGAGSMAAAKAIKQQKQRKRWLSSEIMAAMWRHGVMKQ